jgi:hypothetical protein
MESLLVQSGSGRHHVEGLTGDVACSGDARNTTMAAMSSGSFALQRDHLGSTTFHLSTLTPSCCARICRLASDNAVRVTPGQTELTLILCLPSCCAAVLSG